VRRVEADRLAREVEGLVPSRLDRPPERLDALRVDVSGVTLPLPVAGEQHVKRGAAVHLDETRRQRGEPCGELAAANEVRLTTTLAPAATDSSRSASITRSVSGPSRCDQARSPVPSPSKSASLIVSFAISGRRRLRVISRATVVFPAAGDPVTTTTRASPL
jgi:hypothetical protein